MTTIDVSINMTQERVNKLAKMTTIDNSINITKERTNNLANKTTILSQFIDPLLRHVDADINRWWSS
jgi:hypothetical protein